MCLWLHNFRQIFHLDKNHVYHDFMKHQLCRALHLWHYAAWITFYFFANAMTTVSGSGGKQFIIELSSGNCWMNSRTVSNQTKTGGQNKNVRVQDKTKNWIVINSILKAATQFEWKHIWLWLPKSTGTFIRNCCSSIKFENGGEWEDWTKLCRAWIYYWKL